MKRLSGSHGDDRFGYCAPHLLKPPLTLPDDDLAGLNRRFARIEVCLRRSSRCEWPSALADCRTTRWCSLETTASFVRRARSVLIWADRAEELGVPDVTLHALRHTHASQLIEAGIDVVTISKRLGHANPTVTLRIYAHLFRKRDDKAAAAINAALAGFGQP